MYRNEKYYLISPSKIVLTCFAKEGTLEWGHQLRAWGFSWTLHDQIQRCWTWRRTYSAMGGVRPRFHWLLHPPPHASHVARIPCTSHPRWTLDPQRILTVQVIYPPPKNKDHNHNHRVKTKIKKYLRYKIIEKQKLLSS